jgi:hypothetical protein
MGNASPFIQAEKRHAASVGVPGTLLINGSRYAARIYTEGGQQFQMQGGALQKRTLNATVLCSVLPAALIQDSSGSTRPIELQHVESGMKYRLDTGGVNRSPHGIFWTLDCSQTTAAA